jgi:cytochrome c6
MSKTSRFAGAVAMAVLFAGAMSFAQSSGEATYKAKCQSCHGAQGVPNPGIAKMMGVKSAKDAKALSAAEMIAITTNGKGKMPAFKGKLSEAQIKDAVSYYRTFMK